MSISTKDMREFFRHIYEAKAISRQEYERITETLQGHRQRTDFAEVLSDIGRYRRDQIKPKE